MGIRDEFAAHLDAEIDGFVVYAYPPDNPDIPSIVFAPGDPYQVVMTFGKNGPSKIGTMLDVTIAVPRTDIKASFDLLESTRSQVFVAMAGFVGTDGATARGSDFGRIGTIKAADVEILSGTLDVMIVTAGP